MKHIKKIRAKSERAIKSSSASNVSTRLRLAKEGKRATGPCPERNYE